MKFKRHLKATDPLRSEENHDKVVDISQSEKGYKEQKKKQTKARAINYKAHEQFTPEVIKEQHENSLQASVKDSV